MKKRILSFLLAAVLLMGILPQMPVEAEAATVTYATARSTHKIVMTAEEFVDCLWTAYSRPNYYRNEFPYNLG